MRKVTRTESRCSGVEITETPREKRDELPEGNKPYDGGVSVKKTPESERRKALPEGNKPYDGGVEFC